MTRKSAAKAKPIMAKNSNKFLKQPELPPIEETFDKMKQGFLMTAETAVVISDRIDNLINIRKAAYEFWGNDFKDKFITRECIQYLKAKQGMITACYENIVDVIKSFELEEFLKEDMKDYFFDLMPKCDDVETEEDLFNAFLVSGVVKPWGEKMTQMHHQMLDEQGQRKAMEEDGDGRL